MRHGDLEAVMQLAAGTAESPHWTRQDYERVLRATEDGPLVAGAWVAEGQAGLRGFSVVRWVRGEPAAEVENLAVAQGYRREGIGRALLEACLHWGAGCGASAVRLEVRRSNIAARTLYKNAGFVAAGVRPGYYAQPVEDACILEARVPPQSQSEDPPSYTPPVG